MGSGESKPNQSAYEKVTRFMNPYYLSKTDAGELYLQKSDAGDIYLTKDDAGNLYITKVDGEKMYIHKDEANNTFLTKNDGQRIYLTQDAAQNIYLSNANFNSALNTIQSKNRDILDLLNVKFTDVSSRIDNLTNIYQPKGNYVTIGDLKNSESIATNYNKNTYQPIGNYATVDNLKTTEMNVTNYSRDAYQPKGTYATLNDLNEFTNRNITTSLSGIYPINMDPYKQMVTNIENQTRITIKEAPRSFPTVSVTQDGILLNNKVSAKLQLKDAPKVNGTVEAEAFQGIRIDKQDPISALKDGPFCFSMSVGGKDENNQQVSSIQSDVCFTIDELAKLKSILKKDINYNKLQQSWQTDGNNYSVYQYDDGWTRKSQFMNGDKIEQYQKALIPADKCVGSDCNIEGQKCLPGTEGSSNKTWVCINKKWTPQ